MQYTIEREILHKFMQVDELSSHCDGDSDHTDSERRVESLENRKHCIKLPNLHLSSSQTIFQVMLSWHPWLTD